MIEEKATENWKKEESFEKISWNVGNDLERKEKQVHEYEEGIEIAYTQCSTPPQ